MCYVCPLDSVSPGWVAGLLAAQYSADHSTAQATEQTIVPVQAEFLRQRHV
jgi:hypothetical protein